MRAVLLPLCSVCICVWRGGACVGVCEGWEERTGCRSSLLLKHALQTATHLPPCSSSAASSSGSGGKNSSRNSPHVTLASAAAPEAPPLVKEEEESSAPAMVGPQSVASHSSGPTRMSWRMNASVFIDEPTVPPASPPLSHTTNHSTSSPSFPLSPVTHNQPRTEPPSHDPLHVRIRRQRRQQRPDGDTAPPVFPVTGVQTGEDAAHGPLALGRQGQTTGALLLLLLLLWLLLLTHVFLQSVVEEEGRRPPVGLRGRQGVAELWLVVVDVRSVVDVSMELW